MRNYIAELEVDIPHRELAFQLVRHCTDAEIESALICLNNLEEDSFPHETNLESLRSVFFAALRTVRQQEETK